MHHYLFSTTVFCSYKSAQFHKSFPVAAQVRIGRSNAERRSERYHGNQDEVAPPTVETTYQA
jgi:hypothetical protein